ncbi:anti-sigma factor antagonist BldG [Rugosimonospora acidiphila]|uniref:Anti-sigma factor antagonist n=1 Tax=Rugosimonospora acidiphila TaxID=556531 RepID=A0ABP9RIK1_9ACTN
MELSLSARAAEGHLVLEVAGEIDVYTAPQLRERLIALVEGGARRLIVDLDRVEFLDSTGLGVLVGALKRLRGVNGELFLVCDQERLLKIFRITGLDRVFTMYETVEAATAGSGADAAPGAGPEGGVDPAGAAG